MSEWQPIETAPKDETEILLWFPTGCWQADSEGRVIGFWGGIDQGEPDWYRLESDSTPLTGFDEQPTHWMPLPEPPK